MVRSLLLFFFFSRVRYHYLFIIRDTCRDISTARIKTMLMSIETKKLYSSYETNNSSSFIKKKKKNQTFKMLKKKNYIHINVGESCTNKCNN